MIRGRLAGPMLLVGMISLVHMVGGCAATPVAGTVDDAVTSYDEGRFTESYDESMAILRSGPDDDRAAAAYLAGISAYRLHRREEAELRLRVAAEGSDPDVEAKARAMLGVIRLEQGRHADAGRLLREASPDLDGDDARRATRLADAAGGGGTTWMTPQRSTPIIAAPRAGAMSDLSDVTFVLQAGAFREPDRARSVARDLSGIVRRHGLDPVQVVSSTDARGRPLHLVHFGVFATRQAAARMRSELDRPHDIVTPLRLNATDTVARIR